MPEPEFKSMTQLKSSAIEYVLGTPGFGLIDDIRLAYNYIANTLPKHALDQADKRDALDALEGILQRADEWQE